MVSTKNSSGYLMEHSKTLARRPHSEAFRTQVLSECSQPGASVAAIALAHGLNANLVHKWRRKARQAPADGTRQRPECDGFVALALPCAQQAAPALPDIHMELRRGAATIEVRWPVAAAAECAAWLRDWLR
jgi:transposase